MTNWEAVRKEYETTERTMVDIAKEYDLKPSTVRARKHKEQWHRESDDKDSVKQSVHTRKAIEKFNKSEKLTDNQKNFCLLYLKYFNATKAYQEAYQCDYSTANAHGYRMLSNVVVAKELTRLKELQMRDLYYSDIDLKKELVKQAFADIKDFVVFGQKEVEYTDEDGSTQTFMKNYVDFKESVELDGTLIKEVKMGKDGPVITLHDKQKAIDTLLKLSENSGMQDGGVQFVDVAELMKQKMSEQHE